MRAAMGWMRARRSVRPRQRAGKAGNIAREPLRVHGDEVEQLPPQYALDRLPLACRHVLESDDLDARNAHVKLGEAQQFRNGGGEIVPECRFDLVLIPKAHGEGDELRPLEPRAILRLLRLPLPRLDPFAKVTLAHGEEVSGFGCRVRRLPFEEETAD